MAHKPLSEAQKRVLRSIAETGKLYAKDSRSYDVLRDRELVKLVNISKEPNCWEGKFVLTDEGEEVLNNMSGE